MAKPKVKGVRAKRAGRRLARIRLKNPDALPNVSPEGGYSPREARKIKRKDTRMKDRQATRRAARQYNPLAPLTGPRERQERRSAERLEFGPQARALREETASQQQNITNVAQYYNDYTQALKEATGRIAASNQGAVDASQGRVDTAFKEDSAANAARDTKMAESAQARGIAPTASVEGAKAVEGARSQGNQAVAGMRGQAAADTSLLEKRGATSVQSKAEALTRESAKLGVLGKEKRALAKDRGAFRTDFRRKTRQDEREWATIRKEFGLKEKELKMEGGENRADRKLERQKLAAQKTVANIYAAADKAGARAQVRVAKLQLQKGKISKHQYRTIKNIYEGLPEKGKSTPAKDGKNSDGKTPLQTWERDKVDLALRSLKSAKAKPNEKRAMIDSLVKRGEIPARLARIAWARYLKTNPATGQKNPQTGSPAS